MTDLPERIRNCPIFGTPVTDVTKQVAATPCGSGGDYVALQDRDGYYCISGSVLSLIRANPLNDAEKLVCANGCASGVARTVAR